MAVYFVQASESGRIKIGWTDSDPADRMAALQTGSPEPLRLLGSIAGGRSEESAWHDIFADHRTHGEWFSPAPALTRFIALACADPAHEFLPGSASYQRGYLDAVCRALSILRSTGSVSQTESVLTAIRDNIDTEYHEGIDPSGPAGGFARALASHVARDLRLAPGELPPGFSDLKPPPEPEPPPVRFERYVAEFPAGRDMAEWKRATFYDSDTGSVYLPAFVTGHADETVLSLLGFDGVGFLHHGGHLYAPTSWIATNYPDTKTACENAEKATRVARERMNTEAR